jgi:hypothetical protein
MAMEAKARSGDGGEGNWTEDSLGDCRGTRRAILKDESHNAPRQTRVRVIALIGNRGG